ncbi:hypothetical protein [Escherichia coli]|uniref:hypothetical protein n=1 Tax=Escherichia coli TaxID=562 RepID=UPI003D649CBC
MNYKAFTQIAIDLLPAKLCNCTQAIMTHIIASFLLLCFFNAASLTVKYSSLTDSKT